MKGILGDGKFIQFSPIMNFNWTNSTYNIPLALAFGKLLPKISALPQERNMLSVVQTRETLLSA
jgi:hypothetical protein